jgi:hypothetical protein
MLSEGWKNLIEDIEESQKNHAIIKIWSDIIFSEDHQDFIFKDSTYWCLLGHLEDSDIKDILDDYDFRGTEVKEEGEYESIIIVKKYYDHGETYSLVEDQFDLIRTIKQKEREFKIDNLLF